ncbi:MAG: histidinol-phosphatase [Ignavibacteria bacterium]|nr:histidinol-phosphatase [Ignavibacteria bacterium]
MYSDFLPFARTLADAAAGIVLPRYRSHLRVTRKSDSSPVTEADREAETEMRTLIAGAYPEHGILGEEFGDAGRDAEFVWVLDPIDGTKSYIAGSPLFGTLIALLHRGRPVLGIIDHPALGLRVAAADGHVDVNGAPARMREIASIAEATMLTTDHTGIGAFKKRDGFDRLASRVALYRTWGDCYGYTQLATGFADIMIDPIMSPWDTMALVPIIEGAGGIVTSWEGGDPLASNSIVAASPALHAEVIRALNE